MSTRQIQNLHGNNWKMWRDSSASWENDTLFLPPVDISRLPTQPPTGGWSVLSEVGDAVSVPGTVEAYCWDEIGDYTGVSWWWRTVKVDADVTGCRVVLDFDAVRLRAEVFWDDELVGYDVIGNTPFQVNLTGKVKPGVEHRLAVRITDPGGHFSWEDYDAERWGKYTIPPSHGFGGITGDVRLVISDPVFIEDIFVRNCPKPTDVDLDIAMVNTTQNSSQQEMRIEIFSDRDAKDVIYDQTLPVVNLSPGESKVSVSVSAPNAKLWDADNPNLYRLKVTLSNGDVFETRFGFRWFSVDRDRKRAVFRLNGKRVVLRSAISWSFWPINGMTPMHEFALKQVRMAKRFGLNMLNFHRSIGHPMVLDVADEHGLMYYAEPGGYTSHGGDDFCFAWAREKLLRLIFRDRNHPSLIIYNMINEEESNPVERHRQDMRTVHRLDPTRTITFTSGWNSEGDDPKKLHMLPFDDRQYTIGWTDFHHATGPGVYRDEFYCRPGEFRLHTDNTAEIVFWGEEGAIGTPPRLERINRALHYLPNGWDGTHYRQWYGAYAAFLEQKGLIDDFESVDGLTKSLGNIAFYYQGRTIENVRINNNTDAYVINGWESTCEENHSGIVDCFRNPKGDPKLLAYYNQPLYIAVKLRTKVTHVPANVIADFFIVNELDLKGDHTLAVWLEDTWGGRHWLQDYPVSVTGGDCFGELLIDRVELEADVRPGMYIVRAELRDSHGAVVARGHDLLLLVDWKQTPISPTGAILDDGIAVRTFLEMRKDIRLPDFAAEMPAVDYIVTGDFNPIPMLPIPRSCYKTVGGSAGITAVYYRGVDFGQLLSSTTDKEIHIAEASEKTSAPFVPGTDTAAKDFSVRWTGQIRVPEDGEYRFHAEADDGFRLWIDDELILDEWTDYAWWHGKRPLLLHSKPVTLSCRKDHQIRAEFFQGEGKGKLELTWTTPSMQKQADVVVDDLVKRVKSDATDLVVLAHTDRWAEVLAKRGVVQYRGRMHGKRNWLGSNFFVRQHPLFSGLPGNEGMNWPYQEFAEYDADRYALLLDDEEVVVGMVSDHQHQIGTAVGIVRHGKGRIILSTLEMLPRLNLERPSADVVRKTFCNFLAYAGNMNGQ